MHRTTVAAAHGDRKPTWNYQQVMDFLECSKRHVYNLFDRGDLEGFFSGSGRGLRIYVDSAQRYKSRDRLA
jgi:hypothetical protein